MKNDDNLFSIGEVAKSLGVTRRAILYYEEFGLICPDAKEGTKGNRYYTIDTLLKLRTIRILQGLGLSLSDVRDYLDDAFDLPQMIRRLERQRDELNRHIEGLQERSNTEPPQVKQILTPRQTIYRRTFTAPRLHTGAAVPLPPRHRRGGGAARSTLRPPPLRQLRRRGVLPG